MNSTIKSHEALSNVGWTPPTTGADVTVKVGNAQSLPREVLWAPYILLANGLTQGL